MATADAIVVGGGLVGGAIAFGLARLGVKVAVFDDGDAAFRAARGNFGLVGVQGKGVGNPAYHRWTRLSAERWPELARELKERCGVDVAHQPTGALALCLSEEELDQRRAMLERLRVESGNFGFEYRMLGRDEVAAIVPGIGPKVLGGAYTPYDAQCSTLYLLRALHAAILGLGGRYLADARVATIRAAPRAFAVTAGGDTVSAPTLVIAAGLGSRELAPQIGLSMPVRPQRGQVMITERVSQTVPMCLGVVRQTVEGGIMLGRSGEDVGFDDRTTPQVMVAIARRAVATLPFLAGVRIVRAWGALRVLTPDEYPIYEQSPQFPGAFTATCHSGVTLAAAHALKLAPGLAAGEVPAELAWFTSRRFDVPKAA